MREQIKINQQDAFVLIDGQNDFIQKDGALYVAGIKDELSNEEVIAKINDVFQLPFGYRAASKDRHPRDRHVEYTIYGKHCAVQTKGQLVHSKLRHIYGAANETLEKGMNPAIISYSIATSPKFTEHIEILRDGILLRQKIKRIFIMGWAFTHCVGESAIAYSVQGFEVYVVRDLCRSVPPPHGNPKLMEKKLKLYGVKLINSDQIQ